MDGEAEALKFMSAVEAGARETSIPGPSDPETNEVQEDDSDTRRRRAARAWEDANEAHLR